MLIFNTRCLFVLIRLADVFSRHMKLILSSFFIVGLLGAVAFTIEAGCYIPVSKGNNNNTNNNMQSYIACRTYSCVGITAYREKSL